MEDGGVIEPATVWAVRYGHYSDEVRGELSLDGPFLRFRHLRGSKNIDIPLSGILKVRRLRGSPVLEVRFHIEGGQGRMAFFFSQPPPINDPSSVGRSRRRRKDNIRLLMRENRDKRDLVGRWRNTVAEAVREASR